jgi:hypothetical protein
MHALLEELLAGDEVGPSALDLDVAALGVPAPVPSRAARSARPLSAFDVADEDAEERDHARRRRVALTLGVVGSLAAFAGSVSIGF